MIPTRPLLCLFAVAHFFLISATHAQTVKLTGVEITYQKNT